MPNEMPPPHPDTYAGAIDLDLRIYIRSVIYHALKPELKEVYDAYKDLDRRLTTLSEAITSLQNSDLDTARAISALNTHIIPDEKYILTKEKIVAFMKKQGIK